MSRKVFVIGVGMTKFEKPGRRKNFDYPDMAVESGTKALQDAGVRYDQIEQACVGYVYGDACCGQRALYELGLTGIPIYNVNNACSSGSSALLLGKQLIQGGIANCVMCLGFEKMNAGPLKNIFNDRTHPMDKHLKLMSETCGLENNPLTAQMFGNAGREHMSKYATKSEHFAKIAWKNHKHSVNNPNSQFQDEYTLEQIKESPKVYDHLTKLQCCPTSDGSAAAILASQEFVEKHNLQKQAVEVLAMEMSTDIPSVFADRSCIKLVGYDMTKLAGDKVFAKAGLDRNAVDVVELHDCFSINELLSYEALGLCKPGEGGIMVDRGDNTYGGKYVINPSGGLLSKGHPLGATGLAQCAELSWQLRGMADKRQVMSAQIALQHNIGLGGAAVVALYKLGYPRHTRLQATPVSASNEDDFKCSEIFKVIKSTLEKDGATIVNNVKGIFCFKIENKAGQKGVWFVDAKNGNGSVTFGGDLNPGVTLTTSDENLILLFAGKLNPKTAFFQGKLKLAGDFSIASKLKQLYVQPKAETSKL